MHTLLIIAIFFLMIFLPVIAAQVSRRRRGSHESGSRPVARAASDGPVVTHHLRPRPRKRARH